MTPDELKRQCRERAEKFVDTYASSWAEYGMITPLAAEFETDAVEIRELKKTMDEMFELRTRVITALERDKERLIEALEPFANMANAETSRSLPYDYPVVQYYNRNGLSYKEHIITVSTFRQASTLLAEMKGETKT